MFFANQPRSSERDEKSRPFCHIDHPVENISYTLFRDQGYRDKILYVVSLSQYSRQRYIFLFTWKPFFLNYVLEMKNEQVFPEDSISIILFHVSIEY